ncbi:MAG: ion transporter [Thaumarchaeota archaeon]|nr:ion transporter [Nitrososphaerota archaeon]
MPTAGELDGGAEKNGLLPQSLFVPEADPRKNLRDTIDSILSDKFMVFLSLAIIPIILIPFAINVSPSATEFLDICDWTIIVLFVAEYTSKLYLAKDRWAHFKEPWHLVDLVIVILPFIQYLPALGLSTRGSPSLLLRLLRLPRALAVGGRAFGSRMQASQTVALDSTKESETVIRIVDSKTLTVGDGLTWDDLKSHLADDNQEWLDIRNLSEEGVARLSSLIRVPEPHFKIDLVDEIFPHIDYVQQLSLIFLQSGKVRYPDKPEAYLTISRSGIIIICTGSKIISVSRHGLDVFSGVMESVRSQTKVSFVVSVLYALLDQTLKEYRSVLSEIEIAVIRIAGTPRSKLPRDFLERVYGLNKEVSRLVSNLLHFKELLSVIVSNKVPLEGFDSAAEEDFHVLQDGVSYLNEIADDLINTIRSAIDLYINQTSFETNKILKILAVITSMSVIPSAIGGLLGMNLLDVPYAASLWEVVLVLVISMSFVTYVFIKLGWLKG